MTSQLYETDFYAWTQLQADILKSKHFEALDIDHMIEEMDCLGRSEKRALTSYLEVWLMHKLKVCCQPEKMTRSWTLSIAESQSKIKDVLLDNPSLKPKLDQVIEKAYKSARLHAAHETGLDLEIFPEECPWNKNNILNQDG